MAAADAVKSTVDQFTTASNTAFKDGVEKTLAALNDANAHSKKNLEAVVASVTAATKGAEALGAQAMAFSKTSFENQVAAAKSLSAAKSVQEVAAVTLDLAARARSGALRREEITGGTFTISNLGMYGLDRFDAIINPPQVAILAVGAAREAMVVRGGTATAGSVMTLTLSCDHRVVDGATGAKFLATLKELLEHPEAL